MSGFHLAMDTLAVQLYTSHYLGVFGIFTHENAPMARKLKRADANQFFVLHWLFFIDIMLKSEHKILNTYF